MTRVTVASFNVKNLIGPEQEYYRFEKYTAEEFAWKSDWIAAQLLTMDADVVAFQEVFDQDALTHVVDGRRHPLTAGLAEPPKPLPLKLIFGIRFHHCLR